MHVADALCCRVCIFFRYFAVFVTYFVSRARIRVSQDGICEVKRASWRCISANCNLHVNKNREVDKHSRYKSILPMCFVAWCVSLGAVWFEDADT